MPKNIVLCFDGTWNKPEDNSIDGNKSTNVWHLYQAIDGLEVTTNSTEEQSGMSGRAQIKWYDKGVGTDWYNKLIGGVTGMGLSENIREGYQVLVNCYELGDQVYLFGFSRGAYSARSLAGLLSHCGLVNQHFPSSIYDLYQMYRYRDAAINADQIQKVRQQYSRSIDVHFLGVWDTVGSLGIPIESFKGFDRAIDQFHDVQLSPIVKNAYHALALDEHRDEFRPTLWDPNSPVPETQTLEQRWFPGAHADVGGGYPNQKLSEIPLLWMREKAEFYGLRFSVQCGANDHSCLVAAPTDSYAQFLDGRHARNHKPFYRLVRSTRFGNEVVDESVYSRMKMTVAPPYKPLNIGL